MASRKQSPVVAVLKWVGIGLWKLLLFIVWVISGILLTLIKELHASIKRYLFKNE